MDTCEELIECPLCGLTPTSALATGLRPAILVHPGWVQCECHGQRPYNVAEAMLERSERSESCRLRSEIRECFYEDANRPHEPGGSSSGSARRRDVARSEVREEQEWHGFSRADARSTERIESLVIPVKGKLPAYLRRRWKSEAKTTESRYLRWLISKHIVGISDVPKLPKAGSKLPFKFLVTPQHATLWRAKKDALGCSSPELLAAILLKEWT